MAKKTRTPRRPSSKSTTSRSRAIASLDAAGRDLPGFVEAQLFPRPAKNRSAGAIDRHQVRAKARAAGMVVTADSERLMASAATVVNATAAPNEAIPAEVRQSTEALQQRVKRFHGARASLAWFPWPWVSSACGDRFGYLTPWPLRKASRLPFTPATVALVDRLGELMGDPGRETMPDGPIPAGFTYVGQFVDHDITFDVSPALEQETDATTLRNMRSPSLDLDAVYGRGPALDPFLYVFPTTGPPSAIRMLLGQNTPSGPGGPSGPVNNPGAMVAKTDFDVPRVSSQTAVVGDPRNDENLIVSQFHHAMLRFHNRVVDLLVLAGFSGDIFVEARRLVRHHYQWAVVHDFLPRLCGTTVMTSALGSVTAAIGSPFSMPVEFSVAAYRCGHSMIRDRYWVNHNFPFATLGQVFEFIRVPRLPVLSNWVVDFNALFETGFPVPIFNRARKIDSVLANGLESLPGFTGMMAVLAQRNLRRGLALGLPSGQAMAAFFGVPPITAAQLQSGLPADEVAVLNSANGLLLKKTPLWYYILREAAVREGGDRLGPVGARIVAQTFVRMLKRDETSFLNLPGGFTPSLTAATPGTFTFADLVHFAGVTTP